MFDPSKLDQEIELNTKETKEKLKNKDISTKKEQENQDSNTKKESNKKPSENIDVLKIIEESEKKNEFDETIKQIPNHKKIEENNDGNNEKVEINEKIEENNDGNNKKVEINDGNNNVIFDINVTSIDDILNLLTDKKYDFAIFEPDNENIRITFNKDKVTKDIKYIKFLIYSNILIKAKALTNLTIEETENEQEGSGKTKIKDIDYKIISKVVPTNSGPKLYIKTIPLEAQSNKKEIKKIDIKSTLTYLGIITFISLIIGAAFIGFIVMNAKTPEDVQFFNSLGINLNDINNFIGKAIATIFSILVFIETVLLIIYLFKLSIVKKEFKQKKIRYGIITISILILTFITGSIWMVIDKKIRSLPNWQEMANGDIQLFDNSKLINESFDKESSLIKDSSNLIGPIEIKFDLSFFAKGEEQKGLTIKKYIWDFGNDIIKETPLPTIIHKFEKKGNYELKLTVQEVDLQGNTIEKIVNDIPAINLSYFVEINEKKLNSGGKLVDFVASSLKELGKVEWYFIDNLNQPIWTGNVFRIGKPIFEETVVIMNVLDSDTKSSLFQKIFIIYSEKETALNGEITYKRGVVDDLMYKIQVENLTNDFGNGIIEEFKWIIGDKEITKKGNVKNPSKSSQIKYYFDSYGKHDIKVILTDSVGDTKELNTIIDIPRKLNLGRTLKIYNKGVELEDVQYEKSVNEYYINQIGVPTTLKLDARFIKSDNLLYTLTKVEWDYNSDGDIDEITKEGHYDINKEGNHTITVYYYLTHRKIKTEVVKIKEQIFIEGLRKEAIVDFDINKKGSYVPITVGFDASKSQVKNENIEKFIWSYGDDIIEERDSIVPGHKYITAGNYDVKLTVVTTNGKEYFITKSLILKPKPQTIEISTSMKEAPVGQGIDFSSNKSEGYIKGYLWDFGDGDISIKANPTHTYTKAGTYKVTLKLDFSNKNTLDKTINIKIIEE